MTLNDKIEKALKSYLPPENIYVQKLYDAMEYSLMAGGKRIRPLLVLEFCRLCGGDVEEAVPFACALEMIHTYSLIHDDLPCMDNDDYRRGKLSNHKVFGEDIALLAGDALQSLAFKTATSHITEQNATRVARAVNNLAYYCGAEGMVGGQVIDLESEGKNVGIERLREMDRKKTGAIIKSACEMGCIIAGADENKIENARCFGENIGLAFQGVWAHKMRSFLTMLGVIIGIASIIAIVSTIRGTSSILVGLNRLIFCISRIRESLIHKVAP